MKGIDSSELVIQAERREAYLNGARDCIRRLKVHQKYALPGHPESPQIGFKAVDVQWMDDLLLEMQRGEWPRP